MDKNEVKEVLKIIIDGLEASDREQKLVSEIENEIKERMHVRINMHLKDIENRIISYEKRSGTYTPIGSISLILHQAIDNL